MRFSKVILPLTTQQTARAVELFTSGMVALTDQERTLYAEACVAWQKCIQEAAQLLPRNCISCRHGLEGICYNGKRIPDKACGVADGYQYWEACE